MEDFLKKQIYAGAINMMWKNDRTYILKTPTDNCDAENSGPPET